MFNSLFKKLKPMLANNQSNNSQLPCVLPSPKFINRINDVNQQWLDHCLRKPWIHPKSNTRIHILGISLINCPTKVQIPFSNKFQFRFQGSLALTEIWEQLDEEIAMGFRETAKVSLIFDDTVENGQWMMEDFFPYYDPVLYPKVENFSDWFDYTSGRIKGKTEQLDIHMELPEHWISILKSTGMLPAWDTVSCIQTSKSYLENEEPGPLLSKIEFIGLNESEQINQFNNLKVADTDLFKEDQQLDIPLKQSLEEFYSKNCNVDLDDISKINSGYPGSDSIVQKLVIPPQQLQTYQTILKNSTKIQGDMFKNRLFEKLKKDWIITKNIHLEINDRMDGDVHLLLVDRDIVPSLSHLLKSNNWESQEIANLLK